MPKLLMPVWLMFGENKRENKGVRLLQRGFFIVYALVSLIRYEVTIILE